MQYLGVYLPLIIEAAFFFVLYTGLLISAFRRLRPRLWGSVLLCGLACLSLGYLTSYISMTEVLLSALKERYAEQGTWEFTLKKQVHIIPPGYLEWMHGLLQQSQFLFWVIRILGHICILLGIASIPIFYKHSDDPTIDHSKLTLHKIQLIHPLLLIVLQILTLNFFWLYWLYLTIGTFQKLKISSQWQTPGRTVLYFFIPFINFLWVFYVFISFLRQVRRLSRAVNHEQGAYASTLCTGLWLFAVPLSLSCYFMPRLVFISTLIACTVIAYTHSHLRSIYQTLLTPNPDAAPLSSQIP